MHEEIIFPSDARARWRLGIFILHYFIAGYIQD